MSLSKLERHPHGIDLGPMQSRIPDVLRTPSGKIELAPEPIVSDVPRLTKHLAKLAKRDTGMVLIGRRDLRSNNSWIHNLERLVSGRPRCTLHINPVDAARLGLRDAERVTVRSRVDSIKIPAELTDDILVGVVSIPHGWGHNDPAVSLRIAGDRPGVNSNRLTDEDVIDAPSGNAVLCGIPVAIARANVMERTRSRT